TTDIAAYSSDARTHHPQLPIVVPEAWALGATPEPSDDLLRLALADIKSATASSLGDYDAEEEKLHAVGALTLILAVARRPRAVLEATSIRIVSFDQVTEEHARAEGEGDRTLGTWRRIHERFWREHSARGFSPSMPGGVKASKQHGARRPVVE